MLFVVAAATTVSLHGCGTSSEDLEKQAEQISNDYRGLHSSEQTLLGLISLMADKATASERRRASKTLSAMYKKDAPVDPLTDEEWITAQSEINSKAPGYTRQYIDEIVRDFANMTPEQKSRLKVAVNFLLKHFQEQAKRVKKTGGI